MASVYRLQERIAAIAWDERSLDRVEREVIDRHELSGGQKSGLRQFAWSFLNGREQLQGLHGYRSRQ